jgi:acetyl esterase
MHSRLSAGQTGRRAEAPVSPDRGFSAPTREQQETSFSGANHSAISTMAGDILSDKESAMTLDPDAERVLEMVRQSGRPSYDQVTPAEARALFRAARDVLCPTPGPVAEIRDLAASGPDGNTVPLRLYRSAGTAAEEILPALIYFHGGGWVVGDLDCYDSLCRHLANAARCAVVSVDYRLAPEHKFPAAVDDCLAATRWVAETGVAIGVDSNRLGVGGDSAGGNLAAVVSLLARDCGIPTLCAQLLLYPAVDFAMNRASIAQFAEGHLLTLATMRWFAGHYLRGTEDIADWRASPLRAPDLSRVAPAFVLTAGHDPLCDEGQAYAQRLQDDGVAVRQLHIPDQIHGFLTMGRIVRASEPALDAIGASLKASFDKS